jgi:hypothetical protein
MTLRERGLEGPLGGLALAVALERFGDLAACTTASHTQTSEKVVA